MTIELRTRNLILRRPRKKDIPDLVEGLNNLKISKWLSKVPHPYKKKDAEWWINDCKEKFKKKGKEKIKSYPFSIELKKEKKLIGAVGLHDIDYFEKNAEIGYWVNENYWRQGIIKEALIKIIDCAFKKLKLNRLTIKAYTKNKASNGVAKKMGFKFEGIERQGARSRATGKFMDGNVYSLLKKEWPKARKKLKS